MVKLGSNIDGAVMGFRCGIIPCNFGKGTTDDPEVMRRIIELLEEFMTEKKVAIISWGINYACGYAGNQIESLSVTYTWDAPTE